MSSYKYGFCAWYTPFPGPFALDFAGEVGYDGVQISDLGGDAQAYPLKNKTLQRGFLQAAKRNNLEIQMVNLLSLCMNGIIKSPKESPKGEITMKNIVKGIEACAEMNISAMFIPCIFMAQINNEYDLEVVASYYREAAPVAKAYNIELLFESFMDYDRTMRMYEKSGGAFKLCYDSINPMKYGFGNAVHELRQYDLSMIHTIHIKDSTPDYKEAEIIGRGCGNFFEIAEVIKEIGYKGWIVNENDYFKGDLAKHRDPQELIRMDLETFRKTFEG